MVFFFLSCVNFRGSERTMTSWICNWSPFTFPFFPITIFLMVKTIANTIYAPSSFLPRHRRWVIRENTLCSVDKRTSATWYHTLRHGTTTATALFATCHHQSRQEGFLRYGWPYQRVATACDKSYDNDNDNDNNNNNPRDQKIKRSLNSATSLWEKHVKWRRDS